MATLADRETVGKRVVDRTGMLRMSPPQRKAYTAPSSSAVIRAYCMAKAACLWPRCLCRLCPAPLAHRKSGRRHSGECPSRQPPGVGEAVVAQLTENYMVKKLNSKY